MRKWGSLVCLPRAHPSPVYLEAKLSLPSSALVAGSLSAVPDPAGRRAAEADASRPAPPAHLAAPGAAHLGGRRCRFLLAPPEQSFQQSEGRDSGCYSAGSGLPALLSTCEPESELQCSLGSSLPFGGAPGPGVQGLTVGEG